MSIAYFKYKVLPMIVSVGFHGFLVAMILFKWTMEPPKREIVHPSYVQATLVQLKDQAAPTKKPNADKQQVVDLTKKQIEEPDQQKKIEEQKRVQEKQRQEEADLKKKLEVEQKQLEQARVAKEKAENERKTKELAEKKKQEQKKQEQLKQQKEKSAFDQALAQEEKQLMQETYAAAAQSYMSAISQKIEQNWSRPPSARNNMECELLIKLVPTGRVINVDVVRSSGDSSFDRSAVQAVQKAEQFPVIKDMKPEIFERYYRELNLVFRPQDLRQ